MHLSHWKTFSQSTAGDNSEVPEAEVALVLEPHVLNVRDSPGKPGTYNRKPFAVLSLVPDHANQERPRSPATCAMYGILKASSITSLLSLPPMHCGWV